MTDEKKIITAVPSEADKEKTPKRVITGAPSKADPQTTKTPLPSPDQKPVIPPPEKKGKVLGG